MHSLSHHCHIICNYLIIFHFIIIIYILLYVCIILLETYRCNITQGGSRKVFNLSLHITIRSMFLDDIFYIWRLSH